MMTGVKMATQLATCLLLALSLASAHGPKSHGYYYHHEWQPKSFKGMLENFIKFSDYYHDHGLDQKLDSHFDFRDDFESNDHEGEHYDNDHYPKHDHEDEGHEKEDYYGGGHQEIPAPEPEPEPHGKQHYGSHQHQNGKDGCPPQMPPGGSKWKGYMSHLPGGYFMSNWPGLRYKSYGQQENMHKGCRPAAKMLPIIEKHTPSKAGHKHKAEVKGQNEVHPLRQHQQHPMEVTKGGKHQIEEHHAPQKKIPAHGSDHEGQKGGKGSHNQQQELHGPKGHHEQMKEPHQEQMKEQHHEQMKEQHHEQIKEQHHEQVKEQHHEQVKEQHHEPAKEHHHEQMKEQHHEPAKEHQYEQRQIQDHGSSKGGGGDHQSQHQEQHQPKGHQEQHDTQQKEHHSEQDHGGLKSAHEEKHQTKGEQKKEEIPDHGGGHSTGGKHVDDQGFSLEASASQRARDSFLNAADVARQLVARNLTNEPTAPLPVWHATRDETSNLPSLERAESQQASKAQFLGLGEVTRHEGTSRTQVRLSCQLGTDNATISDVSWAKFEGVREVNGPSFECQQAGCRIRPLKTDTQTTIHTRPLVDQDPASFSVTLHEVDDKHLGVYRCSGVRRRSMGGDEQLVYRIIELKAL